jgi:hypothetical protein
MENSLYVSVLEVDAERECCDKLNAGKEGIVAHMLMTAVLLGPVLRESRIPFRVLPYDGVPRRWQPDDLEPRMKLWTFAGNEYLTFVFLHVILPMNAGGRIFNAGGA